MSATQVAPGPSSTLEPLALKVLIAGGFGVGKTTAVAAVSEIEPLRTDGFLTDVSTLGSVDRAAPDKVGTTVALDFGRVTLDGDISVYLFGTPGQDRFSFMWDDLARGAVAALVIVDTRRLAVSFPAIDACERNGIPFAIAINEFDGVSHHRPEEVREAAAVDARVPVLTFDARDPQSIRGALTTLLEFAAHHALTATTDEPDHDGERAGEGTGPSLPG